MPLAAIAAAAMLASLPDLHVRPPAGLLHLHLERRDITTERSTQTALIATAVLLLALEYAIVTERNSPGTRPPTISQVMMAWGDKYGTLPWTVGVLGGHWFWGDGRPRSGRRARADAMTLGWLTLGVLAWDVADHRGSDRSRAPMLLLGGVVAGHLFWSQQAR